MYCIPKEPCKTALSYSDLLTCAFLSAFRLRAIPPEVTEFEKLRELYLNDNDISVFPVAMSTLVDLRCACQKSPVKFVEEP